MPDYRVDFLNKFARNEKLVKVCQRSIVVRAADSPERAIETAKQRFVELEGIRDWRLHAAKIEIAALENAGRSEKDQKTRGAHRERC
jgi:hypothetical protein